MGEMENGIIAFNPQSGGDMRLGIGDKPTALQSNQMTAIAYTIQQNDGGDHRRKDRPEGGLYVKETDTALTVGSTDLTAIAWQDKRQSDELRELGDISPTMSKYWGAGGGNVPFVGVRRLTPTECARLQGFPDDWNAHLSDSARYRQFGNAVTVNVLEWIGRRILAVLHDA